MSSKLIITWNDGTEEEIFCYDWSVRDGFMKITKNNVTREHSPNIN